MNTKGSLKIKLNLGGVLSTAKRAENQEQTPGASAVAEPVDSQAGLNAAADKSRETISFASPNRLKLKLSEPRSISGHDVSTVSQERQPYRGGGGKMERGRGRGRGRGRKRSHGDSILEHQVQPSMAPVGGSMSIGLTKKIKLSTGNKIKLNLKNLGNKVVNALPGVKRSYPGAKRGRKPGRGRGRPPKKSQAEEEDLVWEDELMYAQAEQEEGDGARAGPGRKPKLMTGNTPASPEDISILIEKIWDRDYDDLFKHPVTDEEAPGYSNVITNPIDLSTIKSKNEAGMYTSWESVASDIHLMFKNALKYNNREHDVWKLAKTQQMHARSLIENARQGKIMLNAKAQAANAARKETIAAKMHAREKRNEAIKKARAEQRAAQEAKILKRAGVDVEDNVAHRSSFRKRTEGMYHNTWQGLAASKTADGVYVGFFRQSFMSLLTDDTSVVPYANSLKKFTKSLSAAAFQKARKTMLNMFPKYYHYSESSEEE
ncbi:hypothetical protein M9434_002457 [Picochlorum sp. BPE23]|nr:hypothetical protein M9434_002457 [Picochlorum sp. BPE23]